ncbi:hypothetical protein ACFVZN_02885 [Streptomyces virginiae]|uniref:hypothetical protein n=1 Tax=Streptomyces virginiae TaxID=1961 RepID=UPI0036C8A255
MFFYNADTRLAASGKLDAAGSYTHLRDLGQFGDWKQIVTLGCGTLFFYNDVTGKAAWGKLDAAGAYTHITDLPAGQPGKSWQVVPVGREQLFFYNKATRAGRTGVIDTAGTFAIQKDYPAGHFATWGNIVPLDNGLLFFYNNNFDGGPSQALSGYVDWLGHYTDLHIFPNGQFGQWWNVQSLAGNWLHFQGDPITQKGATGKLDADTGLYTHVKYLTQVGDWPKIISVGGGYQLFMYKAGPPTAAASGRIDLSGDLKRVEFGSSFGKWSVIVG